MCESLIAGLVTLALSPCPKQMASWNHDSQSQDRIHGFKSHDSLSFNSHLIHPAFAYSSYFPFYVKEICSRFWILLCLPYFNIDLFQTLGRYDDLSHRQESWILTHTFPILRVQTLPTADCRGEGSMASWSKTLNRVLSPTPTYYLLPQNKSWDQESYRRGLSSLRVEAHSAPASSQSFRTEWERPQKKIDTCTPSLFYKGHAIRDKSDA